MIRFIQGHFINFFSPKVLSLCFIWKLEQGGTRRRGKSPTPSSLPLYRSLTVHETLLRLSPHLNFMQPGGASAEAGSAPWKPRHTRPSDSTSLYSNVPMIPCLPVTSISQAPLPPRALAASAGTLPAAWLTLLLCSSSCVTCSGGKQSPLRS